MPAVNQTNSNLAKRWNHGWIGTFAVDDDYCSGTPVGSRPEIHLDDCVVFHPSMSASLGIFFGTGPYAFDQLMLFSDTECQNEMGPLFKEDYTSDNFGCMTSEDTGIFGSIMTVDD